ncbi:MAG TPA: acyl-CoA synthetase [Micromonosporaceae bacterium]
MAGASMSGDELRAAGNAVARDIAGEAVVAVDATPTLETVVAMVGALASGATIVPLPPDSGTAEVAHLLADSGATVVLGRRRAEVRTIPVDPSRRWDTDPPAVEPDRTALLMYTSGTTGPPKGVMLSHAAVAAGIDAVADAWDWTADDTLVHGLPLFHVHGLILGLLGPLRMGSRLVHTGRPSPEAYAAARGTLYFGVPTVWTRVCADPPSARALSGARLLVSGSAPLPVPVFERLHELTGHRPVERYGMTETLITVSSRAGGERRAGYVGFPTKGVRTRLIGDDGAPVAHDGESIGELLVRGPMLGAGYWRQPDATAASWSADGWFRTGDVASIDADGWHRIVGRASTDLIKSGGYRIGAGEVEDALLAHPAVREAAVIGTPDPEFGEQVTAFVVADGVDARALSEFVGGYLSAHKRPRRIEFVSSLPRNAMGKVQKKLLGP